VKASGLIKSSHKFRRSLRRPSGPSFRRSVIWYTEHVRWVSAVLCAVLGEISHESGLQEYSCFPADSIFHPIKHQF